VANQSGRSVVWQSTSPHAVEHIRRLRTSYVALGRLERSDAARVSHACRRTNCDTLARRMSDVSGGCQAENAKAEAGRRLRRRTWTSALRSACRSCSPSAARWGARHLHRVGHRALGDCDTASRSRSKNGCTRIAAPRRRGSNRIPQRHRGFSVGSTPALRFTRPLPHRSSLHARGRNRLRISVVHEIRAEPLDHNVDAADFECAHVEPVHQRSGRTFDDSNFHTPSETSCGTQRRTNAKLFEARPLAWPDRGRCQSVSATRPRHEKLSN
jgi:hypothetical protein